MKEYSSTWMQYRIGGIVYEADPVWSDWKGYGLCAHLRVRRRDGKDKIGWDELQRIKNFVWGEDAVAIEVYPAESDVVNHANIRHLFLVPDSFTVPNMKGN